MLNLTPYPRVPLVNFLKSLFYSLETYDENFDFASKFKSNLPINKKKKPKRNRSAFIIFSSEVNQGKNKPNSL
jgi:hypothetical protein